MTAQKKRDILTGGIAALLIVCAVAVRVITRGHRDAAYFLPVSLLRSFIYIGLMTWWGISLWQRIVQTQVRRYLTAMAALCVFWLSIRTVKFFFAALPETFCQGLFHQIHKKLTKSARSTFGLLALSQSHLFPTRIFSQII